MQDLRDAVRSLRATGVVSAVAVLSLALGIGANTALFTILNSLLLKPLPVRAPEQLVTLSSDERGEYEWMTYPIWRELRDRAFVDGAFVWAADRLTLTDDVQATPIDAVWASDRFFSTLGVPAVLGRTFREPDNRRPGEGAAAAEPIAVIGYGFWQRRFGGAPNVIGQVLTIERVPFTIVGVTPASFTGLGVGDSFDAVLPLEAEPLLARQPSRLGNWPWLQFIGRLPPGQSLDSVTSAARVIQPQIRRATMPDFRRADDRDRYLRAPWTVTSAATGTSRLRTRYAPALATLLGIIGLVLLVACANIANLQLARTAARRHELGVRVAMGASGWRLARLTLVEGLLLSIAGAALGFAFAQWGSRAIVAQLATWYSAPSLDLSPDWRILLATAAVTIATTVLCGTGPALRAARVDPMDALKQRRGLVYGGRFGAGWALVVGQLGLSLLLIASAGIFIRSFVALAYRDIGLDRSRLLVAVIDARHAPPSAEDRPALYVRLKDAVAAVPGVESDAISMATPFGNAGLRFTSELASPGATDFTGREPRIFTTPVSPGWFHTFGTRIIAGRDVDGRDTAASVPVVLVNEAFARRYLNGSNPIGQSVRVNLGARGPMTLEIIGLVQDAAFTSARAPIEPTLYPPLAQAVDGKTMVRSGSVSISVRTAEGVPPHNVQRSAAAAIASIDPNLSASFITVAEQLNANFVRERLLAILSGFFGAFALLLAAIGLYGVTSHTVGRRRTEIGIRMALGATVESVERAVLARVALLSLVGVAGGVLATISASRIIAGLVYSVSPRDPTAIGSAAGVLTAIAIGAGWLPARRVARIDPVAVLRE
jgi:putative ABC transport system permease protein